MESVVRIVAHLQTEAFEAMQEQRNQIKEESNQLLSDMGSNYSNIKNSQYSQGNMWYYTGAISLLANGGSLSLKNENVKNLLKAAPELISFFNKGIDYKYSGDTSCLQGTVQLNNKKIEELSSKNGELQTINNAAREALNVVIQSAARAASIA